MKCVEPTSSLSEEDFYDEDRRRIEGFSVLSSDHSAPWLERIPKRHLFGIRADAGKVGQATKLVLQGFPQRSVAKMANVNRGTVRKIKTALIAYLGRDGLIAKQDKALIARAATPAPRPYLRKRKKWEENKKLALSSLHREDA